MKESENDVIGEKVLETSISKKDLDKDEKRRKELLEKLNNYKIEVIEYTKRYYDKYIELEMQ